MTNCKSCEISLKEIKKKNIINEMISSIKKCYDTKKCQNPFTLHVIRNDNCEVCEDFEKEITPIFKKMSKLKIPMKLKIYNSNTNQARKIAKKLECDQLPCIGLSKNNNKKIERISQGSSKPIGLLCKISGFKNPLIYNKKDYKKSLKYPKNLAKKSRIKK